MVKRLTHETYEGRGFLFDCQQWQARIDSAPTPIEKDVFGMLACDALSEIVWQNGLSPKILVSSYRAIMLPTELTPVEESEVLEFDRVVAAGWLGRINYLVINKERTLTWPLYDARALNPSEQFVTADDLAEIPVPHLSTDINAGPIHLPVGYIDFAVYSG